MQSVVLLKSANYKENKGGGAGDQDGAASSKVGDEVRLGDGHDPPVQGESFLRPTCFALLFFSDRVPAGRVHGPGSQVRARPGGEVLQIRSAQVESGKKCGGPTNSRITMMDVLIQTKQQMNETVSFPTNGCTIVTKNRTHCAEVPTQIDCQERTVFNH